MTDFVRRLVSGNKARFKDGELDLDLDLVYISDQVIVMGYPAAGIEGLYRNRREDAKRFLEHRHGKNFWVFNFCPVAENSYPASVFDGRVSRYPFPDHHAPPFAILALVAREMRTWLSGSPDRVAVLHCKAGKGRSGTMACAYLLALSTPSSPPQLGRQKTAIAHTTTRAEEVMNAMPPDEAHDDGTATDLGPPGDDPIKQELASNGEAGEPPHGADAGATLSEVLALHTARRMRPPNSSAAKAKQGVSIPSQRRWLYYWSLLLARQAPPGFWPADPRDAPAPKVRLTQLRVRMHELGGAKTTLVRAANAVIDRTMPARGPGAGGGASARSKGQVWASLARYDDEMVDLLETWERRTRGENGDTGQRRTGLEHAEGKALAEIFADGKWDRGKMVRSFAQLDVMGKDAVRKEESQTDEKLVTRLLRPSSGDKWDVVRDWVEHAPKTDSSLQNTQEVDSEDPTMSNNTQTPKGDGGVVLDANREVRIKLCMGQVFMGWFWFIPTFHMPHPRVAGQSASLLLRRKELDFPLGIGSNIVDVEVSMEWCPEAADVIVLPPRRDSPETETDEPGAIAATLQAAAAGDFSEVVETKQAAED